jgi:hypothetical protein
MRSNLVALIPHSLQKGRIVCCCVAEDKERRAGAISAEGIEQLWCVLRWTIVECDGNGVWDCAVGDDLSCWDSFSQGRCEGTGDERGYADESRTRVHLAGHLKSMLTP